MDCKAKEVLTKESLVTDETLVGLVPGVGADVDVEATVLRELLTAHVTLEGAFSWMGQALQ